MSVVDSMIMDDLAPRILATVSQYWGYDTLRPLQDEAIRAGLDRRGERGWRGADGAASAGQRLTEAGWAASSA